MESEGSLSTIMSVVNTLDHTHIKNELQFRPTAFIDFHDYMAHSSLPTLLIMNLLINLLFSLMWQQEYLFTTTIYYGTILRFKLTYP